ncbi:MAG: substrate-binding domain-containing protein [Clostridia bacterium]|nr:substrate-binding domain-containing protein [Clostridia bacterium]
MIDRNSMEPLYVQVKNHIITSIENGELKIGDKLMSENEMLKFYGVGRVTIRNALSELVAEGCLRKEQGLGTFVMAYPKKAKRLNIDVLLDAGDTYFVPAYVLKGISPVLEQNNCNLLMHDTKHDSKHIVDLLNSILDRGTDGVLMQPVFRDFRSAKMDAVMERYDRAGVPVVILLGSMPNENCIYLAIDDEYGTEIAARYLLECGHRKILGLFHEKDRNPTHRLRGFRKAFQGVADAEVFEIITPNWEKEVLHLVRDKKITAIQCYNDHVAVECLRVLVENGIRVPQDISLVGFDDSEIAQNSIPRLTTMTHPKDHLGRAAAEAVLRRIRNPSEVVEGVTYRPGLVIRQSVRNLNENTR